MEGQLLGQNKKKYLFSLKKKENLIRYYVCSFIYLFLFLLIATEIRCQEKSRGGLSYEVILAEPAPNVTVPKKPVTPGKNVSAEEIEQKLKAAEERRIVCET